MRVKWSVRSLLSAAFCLSNCVCVLAQGTTASINGTVLDVNGAAVPGATVSIKHVGTSATRINTTDDSGRYVAVGLPVGDYEVRVEHGGFAPLIRTNIKLNVHDKVIDSPGLSTLDLSLMKTFKLTERQSIDFRWEVFNSLNHTNLGAPNIIVLESSGRVAPTAGIITQTATTSRQMQFSAKYRF